MPKAESTSSQRLVFFDNLRYLMVLLVLVFHSGASYGSIVGFWPYHDPHPTEAVDILMLLLDVFIMSVLFFIAGYFAMPSLLKRGSLTFLKDKLRYLGIPWLTATVLVLPVLDYVHYYSQALAAGAAPRHFALHWWLAMQRILDFYVGPMRMSGYLDMSEHFYQRYMWFLSLLLAFFVLLVLFFEISRRVRGPAARTAPPRPEASPGSAMPALAVTALLGILLFALIKVLTSSLDQPFNMSWFSLGNLLQFEAAKLSFYLPCFGLGLYAWSRKWFAGGGDLGSPRVWISACLVLTVVNLLVGRSLARLPDPAFGLQVAFLVVYPVWTFSFVGTLIAFAARRWNHATPLDRSLAANSFNMYLVHYAFVMLLPLLLANLVQWPALLKFPIVATVTILASYALSRYALQPAPRLVLATLIALNLVLVAAA